MLIQMNYGNKLPHDLALVLVHFVDHLLREWFFAYDGGLCFFGVEAIAKNDLRPFFFVVNNQFKPIISTVMAINVVIIGLRVFYSQENVRL